MMPVVRENKENAIRRSDYADDLQSVIIFPDRKRRGGGGPLVDHNDTLLQVGSHI